MQIMPQEMEELRLGAITAIDGLWFLAAERKFGFEKALELDLEVWRDYGVVMLKRLARKLDIDLRAGEAIDLSTVNYLMESICHIDGTQASGEVGTEKIIFRVESCSWWENLSRAGREKIIPCEDIDNHVFAHWLKAMDPSLDFEITHSRPRGDAYCTWSIGR